MDRALSLSEGSTGHKVQPPVSSLTRHSTHPRGMANSPGPFPAAGGGEDGGAGACGVTGSQTWGTENNPGSNIHSLL